MIRGVKKIVIAASFMFLGLIIFAVAMTEYGWDFTQLSTAKYETNTHEVSETFESISIETGTADIVFLPSSDGKCKVVCYEKEKIKHYVDVKNSTLSIEQEDAEWYNQINFFDFKSPKITVYLPASEYKALFIKESTGDVELPKDFTFETVDISVSTGDVEISASAKDRMKIKATTGDIDVINTAAGSLDLSVSTGRVKVFNTVCEGEIKVSVSTGDAKLTDVTCGSAVSTGSTGDIYLKNTIVSGKLSIERDTGDVNLERCDAGEIFIETDTGDVEGSLLSAKVFIASSDTGSINVPRTTTGGVCEIITDTGDIEFTIED